MILGTVGRAVMLGWLMLVFRCRHQKRFQREENRHGPRFMDKFAAGPETVFDLIETHPIKCEATRNGTDPCGTFALLVLLILNGVWFDWREDRRTG